MLKAERNQLRNAVLNFHTTYEIQAQEFKSRIQNEIESKLKEVRTQHRQRVDSLESQLERAKEQNSDHLD
jgi:hypothetical protein